MVMSFNYSKWFLEMLARAKEVISNKAKHFKKHKRAAKEEFSKTHNQYLMDSIYALYVDYIYELLVEDKSLICRRQN